MSGNKKGNRPGIRRVGRTLAFQVLYGTHFDDPKNPVDIGTAFERNPMVEEQESETAREFARALVLGVDKNLARIDAAIGEHSQHWKFDRIAVIELSILRLSLYEMLFTDIPVKAAINEAIELSKLFGDEKSRGFVNGILDGVARTMPSGKA
ncbi:MAG: transcription antitermination factor NusB [Pseudodesulfovibrio sp.]|uniref:Transcription antitermination protein NusB n=1 Tax=Pseudodesulfovibrio aespoeensis (strain ATCC 700646 / DSM 10631 / Aspo-2) TaxID=643562 RepID=E6VY02_PSEA9|nr:MULTISPECIES: transcription antitermination factor NusB [Pseudodesulfovibrio]MBU4191894.1 transcription antitermination factor NusB [Pseudomonadota bacterium]ADU63816.1 transcription antitermination factor NusB [Pseudodesulfovibrio aespoeensis Aspo-2]MBU4242946.1 transcription antitermination factor NusB [Pseudomonadota bacterium]MBU4379220.1 transcription antitermination factor NusB [Pseudomonadota bacterium]MBU4475590.1 transcription antitermination factor NusB [Pseudomonadota bacterium]